MLSHRLLPSLSPSPPASGHCASAEITRWAWRQWTDVTQRLCSGQALPSPDGHLGDAGNCWERALIMPAGPREGPLLLVIEALC